MALRLAERGDDGRRTVIPLPLAQHLPGGWLGDPCGAHQPNPFVKHDLLGIDCWGFDWHDRRRGARSVSFGTKVSLSLSLSLGCIVTSDICICNR